MYYIPLMAYETNFLSMSAEQINGKPVMYYREYEILTFEEV